MVKQKNMKVKFEELFNINNSMFSPKVEVGINGVIMGPGVSFGKGALFGGIDLSQYISKYLEIELVNNIHQIKGIYNN